MKIIILSLLLLASCGKSKLDEPKKAETLSPAVEMKTAPIVKPFEPPKCFEKCSESYLSELDRINKLIESTQSPSQYKGALEAIDRNYPECKKYCDFCAQEKWDKDVIFKTTPGPYSCSGGPGRTMCGYRPEAKNVECNPVFAEEAMDINSFW